jgi:hypothetical protein
VQANEANPVRSRDEVHDEGCRERIDDRLHVDLHEQEPRHHRRRRVRLETPEEAVQERRYLKEREQHGS